MKILLIEPSYSNKYPPLGLMKISTYHKRKGDEVVFYKGLNPRLKNTMWDRIYISTLFTFHWAKTVKTINYYLKSVFKSENLFVGGVLATVLRDKLYDEFRTISIIEGLLNEAGKIGYQDDNMIDSILPDYSIIDPQINKLLNYVYQVKDNYLAYATRGCVRKCSFCAVPIIEPVFSNSISIKEQVEAIKENFGEKRDLILMDNNILASKCFKNIIEEIKELGFGYGATYKYKSKGRNIISKRHVDFNQGIDARLLTEDNLKLLSEIAVKPLRIAFDDIFYKDLYISKVRLAAQYRIKTLSNYILFNYNDTPDDFYERLKINIRLNEEFLDQGLDTQVWSFPMKYTPVIGEEALDRKYIGKNWNRKYLRGIQCILLATHGVVGPKRSFFEKAFGKDCDEFKTILLLPEDYIISRKDFESIDAPNLLKRKIESISEAGKRELFEILLHIDFNNNNIVHEEKEIQEIIEIYRPVKYKH
jgi:hypothetical protein